MSVNKINNYRWIILSLLFFATTINYLDRQLIGLLKPILEKEFKWSEIDYAHITMAFTASYAIGLVSIGWLIDKIGTRLGYAITIIFWSVAGILHVFAKNAFGFGIARVGLGLGEGGNYPAAMKTVAEWFPDKERAIATGVFNMGTSIGVVVALLIVPFILQSYGWQYVFVITGSLGFIWLVFWMKFYTIPSQQKRLTSEEHAFIVNGQQEEKMQAQQTDNIKWIKLFRFPQTWAYITGKGLIDPIYWFFLFWLPSYFSSAFHLDLKKPNLQLLTIYAATTAGSFMGGYFSSSLIKKGWPVLKARKMVLLLFALIELSIFFVQFATSAWMAVALLSLAVAVHQAWATNIFTTASDMFPKEAVSSVVGIGGMAGAVGGILFPLLVGNLLETYKTSGNITAGYNLLFTICAFTYLVAWTIIHLLTRNIEKVKLSELY
jgi:MFS transporter, ACS family, hexuronate transporter